MGLNKLIYQVRSIVFVCHQVGGSNANTRAVLIPGQPTANSVPAVMTNWGFTCRLKVSNVKGNKQSTETFIFINNNGGGGGALADGAVGCQFSANRAVKVDLNGLEFLEFTTIDLRIKSTKS